MTSEREYITISICECKHPLTCHNTEDHFCDYVIRNEGPCKCTHYVLAETVKIAK